ncbi:MAG: serine/threonine-protein kinase [Planctomycetota bacterium]
MNLRDLSQNLDSNLQEMEQALASAFDGLKTEIDASSILDHHFQIGSYRLQRLISCGGQAFVFDAFDIDLQREVVLKLYRRGMSTGQREQILHEGRILANFDHHNIARCLTVDSFEAMPFLVMEKISGKSLDDYAKEKMPDDYESVAIVRDIAVGLSVLHDAGFLHLDLKPSNIMVTNEGVVKLIDFGLSQSQSEQPIYSGSGTPSFIAPERMNMESDSISEATDVFGLGGILYFLLTGDPPFKGRTREEVKLAASKGLVLPAIEVDNSIEPSIRDLCSTCLARRPSERFATSRDFVKAANGVLHQKERSKRMVRYALVSAALVVAVLASMFYLPRWSMLRQSQVMSRFADQRASEVFHLAAAEKFPELKNGIQIKAKLVDANGQSFPQNQNGVFEIPDQSEFGLHVTTSHDCYIGIVAFNSDQSDGLKKIEPIFPWDSGELARSFVKAQSMLKTPVVEASVTNRVEYFYCAACDFPWLPVGHPGFEQKEEDRESDLPRGVERQHKPQPKGELLIPFRVVESATDT